MLSTHQKIKYSIYKNLRRCKSFFLLIYIGICFFEKPFYCYCKTTLPFGVLAIKPICNKYGSYTSSIVSISSPKDAAKASIPTGLPEY